MLCFLNLLFLLLLLQYLLLVIDTLLIRLLILLDFLLIFFLLLYVLDSKLCQILLLPLPPLFFLFGSNILIKCFSIFFERQLLIIIDWRLDDMIQPDFLFRTAELRNIAMLQSLFDSDPFLRVEYQQLPQQIHSFF